ncbi:MAG: tol-pal system protein YbgF [Halofilum sp. (in: g-proteobacteria)]|nr:tol-pal system protein YbgF [Halofilum sp. (in: g-proteobacteria)]
MSAARPPASPRAATSDAASESSQPRDPKAERKAYDAAFQLLREGRYDDAAGAFSQFLKDFPDGPYADNAQYWLGEARYVTRNFEPALEAFRTVVAQHPDSAKVPDARLKMGYTLYEMGRYDEARKVLETVTKQHRDSAVARLAEERLVRMKNEGH